MRSKGFTLIEVLIALAILAMAFAALFTTMTQVTGNQIHIMNKTYGNWVADNVMNMASLHQLSNLETSLSDRGTVTMGHEPFTWEAKKSTTPDEFVDKIEIKVQDKNKNVVAELTGYSNHVEKR